LWQVIILLLDVLKDIPDVSSLVDISIQLKKAPTEENKYLQENDRQEIVTVAGTYFNTAVRTLVAKIDIDKERKKPTEILELYKLYQRLQKVWPGKDFFKPKSHETEKELLGQLKDLYVRLKNKEEEKDKISDTEVIRFYTGEVSKARALANPKPGTVPMGHVGVGQGVGGAQRVVVGQSSGAVQKVVVPSQQASKVSGAGDIKKDTNNSTAAWQQWGKLLADQQRMLQFQQMIAMAPALPNMTPKDMAAFCGLTDADITGLSSYIQGISSLTCQQLASMGITSSQLTSLAQIASLTKISPNLIQALAKKQAQFEQEYLRKLMGGTSSSTATTTSQQTKPMVTNVASKKTLGVKQTVGFKAKPTTQMPAQVKKSTLKMLQEIKAGTNPGASDTVGANLNSVAHKLSSAGVTISKPAPAPVARSIPSTAARNTPSPQARTATSQPVKVNNPSPLVRTSLPQGVSITKQPTNHSMNKKFPHLNISNVDQNNTTIVKSSPSTVIKPSISKVQPASGAGSSNNKTAISVKPNATLLKPAAAVTANQSQQAAKQSQMDAKSKLALFKAQMKKTLNIPGAQKKSPAPSAGSAKPVTARPVAVGAPKKTTANQMTGTAKQPGQAKKKPPPKPSVNDDVICIDID